MQHQEVHDQPIMEEPYTPEWTPLESPGLGEREWFVMIYERFGFIIATVVTLLIFAVLFFNTDLLLRDPDKGSAKAVLQEQGSPVETQDGLSETEAEPAQAASLIPEIDTLDVDSASYQFSLRSLAETAVAEDTEPETDDVQSNRQDDTHLATLGEEQSLSDGSSSSDSQEDEAVTAYEEPMGTGEPPPSVSEDVEQTAQEQPASPSTDNASREGTPVVSEEAVVDARAEDVVTEPVEASRAPVGQLQIDSDPAGASVSLAGTVVGETPLIVSAVEVGRQSITFRLAGYEDYTMTVSVVAGERQRVSGALEPLSGTLKILAKPWGTIYIDGTLHKSETNIWYTAKLSPGTHLVEIEHATLGRWKQSVILAPGEERSLTVDFK